jgi:hypothetical protein
VHNLHLVVVNADSHEDACDTVRTLVEGFGTENNWFVVSGAISKDTGEIYSTEEGRFDPAEILLEENNSVKFIKDKTETALENLESLYQSFKKDSTQDKDKLDFQDTLNKLMKDEPMDSFKVYLLKEFIEHKYAQIVSPDDSSVWDGYYFSHEYDRCGLTNHTEHGENLYCVFVDMHS